MYYVGISISGGNNRIGVAFSNDGTVWKKYPHPIIFSSSEAGYGVGQPALYNADHRAAISMFYEDTNPTVHHIAAVSTDGVHFTMQVTLTANGLDSDDPDAIWGDMSYDAKQGEWYAVFNRPLRPPSTTGGVWERGQYGIELYKIPQSALLTGTSPWQELATLDTNSTGYESNFIAGFVRDLYGNINVASYPTIQMYTSVSYIEPSWDATPAEAGYSATQANWVLMPMQWKPNSSTTVPLNLYFNGRVHEVTTGGRARAAGFKRRRFSVIFTRVRSRARATVSTAVKSEKDYFVSLDVACEGQRTLGKDGYGYPRPVSGLNLVALYRCSTGYDHFVSQDPKCEGHMMEKLLGYALP